uniref:Uncharacterized protein n=1 Tax=Strigamia maritima TaxID=126957 RepID=T1IMG7_STRMM
MEETSNYVIRELRGLLGRAIELTHNDEIATSSPSASSLSAFNLSASSPSASSLSASSLSASSLSASSPSTSTPLNTRTSSINLPFTSYGRPSTSSGLMDEYRGLFRYGNKSSKPRKRQKTNDKSLSWTHEFCCLASCDQTKKPQKEEKTELFAAGLGQQKISFPADADWTDVKGILIDVFPKLQTGGGFELMRLEGRINLKVIEMPASGYSIPFLKSSHLGQALCYIRPIQVSLDLTPSEVCSEVTIEIVTDKCFKCNMEFPLKQLRDHVQSCKPIPSDDDIT